MKKNPYLLYFIFTSAYLLSCSFVFSQQAKIDSLTKLLKKDIEDTGKVNHLVQLSEEYKKEGVYDSSLSCGKQALALALKKDFAKGVVHAYYNTGLAYYFQGDYVKSLDYFFKGITASEQIDENEQTNSDKEFKTYILQGIASCYFRQGDYTKTLDYFFRTLKITEEIGEKQRIASLFSGIGIAYRNQGNFAKALDYDQKALKIKEELGDKKGIAGYLGNIGMIYDMQKDFAHALDYRFKALQVAQECGDKNVLADCLGNIGIIYNKQASGASAAAKDSLYEKAREYFFRALSVTKEIGNKNTTALWLYSVGNAYYIQSKNEKLKSTKEKLLSQALDYCFQSLKMKQELGNKFNIATQISNIGSICLEAGKYPEAEKYLQDALKIDKEIGALEQEMNCEDDLSSFYEKTGRADLALKHYKRSMELQDTLFNTENTQKIAGIQFRYEQEKKDKIRELEQKTKEQQHNAEIEKQRIISWSLVSGLLLVVVFAGFIFRSLYITRKQKKVIEIKNKETEEQKKIIEEKNKDITDSINYAQRIQKALLASDGLLAPSLKREFAQDYFILFKPKDIVSGDFYWATKVIPDGEDLGGTRFYLAVSGNAKRQTILR